MFLHTYNINTLNFLITTLFYSVNTLLFFKNFFFLNFDFCDYWLTLPIFF